MSGPLNEQRYRELLLRHLGYVGPALTLDEERELEQLEQTMIEELKADEPDDQEVIDRG